jgi:hypothetical protein
MGFGRGKKVKNNRKPVGVCDRTAMFYNFKDLVKQYEWYGNKLMWTGLMVGMDEVDTPNENLRPYKIRPNEGKVPLNNRPPQEPTYMPPYDEAIKNLIKSSDFQG